MASIHKDIEIYTNILLICAFATEGGSFNFSAKYKSHKANFIVHALYRRHHLLETKVQGFELIKELHPTNLNFLDLYLKCLRSPNGPFYMKQGFLFQYKRLCIAQFSLRFLLSKEVHGGTMSGQFGLETP